MSLLKLISVKQIQCFDFETKVSELRKDVVFESIKVWQTLHHIGSNVKHSYVHCRM